MPKVRTREISVDPKVGVTSPRSPGVSVRGVAKARDQRGIDTGLGGAVEAAAGLANFFIGRDEKLRKSNVANGILDMKEAFVERNALFNKDDSREAAKQLEQDGPVISTLDSLREAYIPEDLDPVSKREYEEAFRKLEIREKNERLDFMAKSAIESDKIARSRQMTVDLSEINTMNPTQIKEVAALAMTSAIEDNTRSPDRSDIEKENFKSVYTEKYLTNAFLSWFVNEPILATEAWENNKALLQESLPNNFDALSQKYKTSKDFARGDRAVAGLKIDFPGDPLAQANALSKDPEKYYGAKGYDEDALSLAAKLRVEHNFNVSEKARADKEAEEKVFIDADDKFRNEKTGVVDLAGYLSYVEAKWRGGFISKTAYDAARKQVLVGELSNDEYLRILNGIENGAITTNGQISELLAGRNTKSLPYLRAQLKGIQDNAIKNMRENQFANASETYKLRAAQEAQDDTVVEKLDGTRVNTFTNHLRAWASQQGYVANDPRIHVEAERLLKSGHYKKIGGEPLGAFTEGEPSGKLRALDFFSPSLEVIRTRRFEYDALEAEKATGETATSGNLDTSEDQAAVKFLKDNKKQVNAETLIQAKEILRLESGD